MIDYKMGVVKSDDQDFGNEYSISLREKDGTETETVGYRPKNFHGVHALIQTGDDEYNLLCEDDGHFRTHAILNRELIDELVVQLKKIREGMVFKPNFKVSYTRAFRLDREHEHFPSTVKTRGRNTPLVDINFPTTRNDKWSHLMFDASLIDDLLNVLDIDNWKER